MSLKLFQSILLLLASTSLSTSHSNHHIRRHLSQEPLSQHDLSINSVPFSTRAYWMRRANQALTDLGNPCPFAAFGSVIVNHTDPTNPLGTLICIGANANSAKGNPTLHGEIAAINNCSAVLQAPPYSLTPAAALAALPKLSLYTNAESCPMCASAIRWAGFREYVYGTPIDSLIEKGWRQIRVASFEIFEKSMDLPNPSRLIAGVLTNETDPYFSWQYDPIQSCPKGCARVNGTGSCAKA
ncbi:TAD2-subunit of tRNA-specific adenosine-34 deaminase [Venturia nashicola]|uniref:TAD2-subunit of tRNA-specific adenosine-34 deaminase n=1 Tax=Venturia nashicola TaxID=86259 RepID=A0A4Z1NBV8_9PEZI|nr:TAD2-subunit of tRNA-specific adenosine-34 deaminase [Venturia nashicola]TLD14765.1 TAD2-subunit of tRNA-specific adenosine-34 deaminase [Venturia nashicola]